MEVRINLATASLKDAEHAIFIIGAYHGMTNLPGIGDRRFTAVELKGMITPDHTHSISDPSASHAHYATGPGSTQTDPAHTHNLNDPGVSHGAALDPAAVFGGNVATGPVGVPASPAAGQFVPPAAGPAVGDVGNVAATAAGPVGTSPTPTPAPAPGASVPPVGVELDAAGLPWDPRIHASGEGGAKPKNADGKWRKKRGLNDAAFVGTVEAELRATLAAGAPAAQAQPPVPPNPVHPNVQEGALTHAAPPQPPAMPQAAPTTFEQLMPRITSAVLGQTLPQGALLQAVTAYQLPNIPSLAQRPDLVPTIWAYLQSLYPALV